MKDDPIIGVAMKVNRLTICLPKPNRHHHLIAHAVNVIGLPRPCSGDDQGFYTASGIFLNRKAAMMFAIENDQLLKKPISPNELYSEDVW